MGASEFDFDPKTTDYCDTCGESPDSASHGPFSGSHPYALPTRDERVLSAKAVLKVAPDNKHAEIKLASWIIELDKEHRKRLGELHQAIAKLTHETPFPDEFDECRRQRAALIAEVGTLRAALREACELGRSEFDRLASQLAKLGRASTSVGLDRFDRLQALAGDGD